MDANPLKTESALAAACLATRRADAGIADSKMVESTCHTEPRGHDAPAVSFGIVVLAEQPYGLQAFQLKTMFKQAMDGLVPQATSIAWTNAC